MTSASIVFISMVLTFSYLICPLERETHLSSTNELSYSSSFNCVHGPIPLLPSPLEHLLSDCMCLPLLALLLSLSPLPPLQGGAFLSPSPQSEGGPLMVMKSKYWEPQFNLTLFIPSWAIKVRLKSTSLSSLWAEDLSFNPYKPFPLFSSSPFFHIHLPWCLSYRLPAGDWLSLTTQSIRQKTTKQISGSEAVSWLVDACNKWEIHGL